MTVLINNYILEPAPFVSIAKNYNFTTDGRPIGNTFQITLNGDLLPNMGSPFSTGWYVTGQTPGQESFSTDDEKFNSLVRKQGLLREALNQPGFRFRYHSSGLYNVDSYPTLQSISFEEGPWVLRSRYNIVLTAYELGTESDSLTLSTSGLGITSITDSWSAEQNYSDETEYGIVRTVAATASSFYRSGVAFVEPWVNAKSWVENRLSTESSIPIGLATGNLYYVGQTVDIDRFGGTYSVVRQYKAALTGYSDERTIQRNTTYPTVSNSGGSVTVISVNGRIKGLTTTNDPSGAIVNAYSYWNSTLYPSLGSIVGASGSPRNFNLTENFKEGVLEYSVQYTNVSLPNTYTLDYTISESQGSNPGITIQSTLQGLSDSDDPDEKFKNAISGLNSLNNYVNFFRLLALSGDYPRYLITGSNIGLQSTQTSVDYNKPNGSIGVNLFFPENAISGSYNDIYTVTYNREDSLGVVNSASIRGTIYADPFASGANYWDTTVRDDLFNRVSGIVSQLGEPIFFGSTPNSLSLTNNFIAKQIEYSAQFDNSSFGLPSTGVVRSNVTIQENAPSDLIAIQNIPGRAIGPIIQNIGTRSEMQRSIDINLICKPKAGNSVWTYPDITFPRSIAANILASSVYDLGVRGTGYFVTSNSDNWDWKNGVYSRNTTVTFAPTG